MPHSSGGGSHGGGHHGGGGHHSSGGSRGSSGPRVSTTRFAGSRRYSYYDRHHNLRYIYCSKDPAKAYKIHWWVIIFYIPFIWGIIMAFGSAMHVPHKVYNTDATIVIKDELHILKDKDSLRASLREFYDETGVTPAVYTVYHEDWKGRYSNLEKYAYDLYTSSFSDEKHWLVVYSLPSNHQKDDFKDWKWEGMIGDDVGSMVTSQNERFFTTTMHKHLSQTNQYTVDQAIALTFKETIPETKKTSVDFEMIAVLIFIVIFLLFHACGMMGLTPGFFKYRKAVLDPEPQEIMIKCAYCDSSFVWNGLTNCPNCGGRLEYPTAQINNMRKDALK